MTSPIEPVLLVYASTHGHTGKIAMRMAERVRGSGTHVRVVDVEEAEALDPSPYAVVVVGGSIHVNGHQPALRAWLGRFGEALDPARTALFSVSLTAADDSDEGREAAGEYVQALATDAGVTPALASAFAGALAAWCAGAGKADFNAIKRGLAMASAVASICAQGIGPKKLLAADNKEYSERFNKLRRTNKF